MKTEVKKIDGSKCEISVTVTGDIVKKKFEDVFKKITQEAKVPGFRPGNAPRDIVEKQFSSAAHEQVLKELVPDIYSKAVEQEKLDVIELPEIFDVKLDRANLSFKANVEVRPEIPVKNYKGIKIEYKKALVQPEEVKRQIDSLKESRKADALDDKFAKGLGYLTLSELEQAIERQALLHKEEEGRRKREDQIIETLLKGVDFKMPQSLVERQLQDMLRQAKLDLALKGVPREKIDGQEKEMLRELEPEARRQVKLYLILAEVAKKENIPVDEHMPRQVMELLLRQADWQEIS